MPQYPYDSSSVGPAPRVRTIINMTDNFAQAGARYRSLDSARQVLRIADLSAYPLRPSADLHILCHFSW